MEKNYYPRGKVYWPWAKKSGHGQIKIGHRPKNWLWVNKDWPWAKDIGHKAKILAMKPRYWSWRKGACFMTFTLQKNIKLLNKIFNFFFFRSKNK